MTLEAIWHAVNPLQVQRLVAGNPEHLLIERRPQALCGAEQLFLVQLQGDGFIEHCAQFAIEPLEQVGAGGGQFHQAFAQLRRDLLGGLGRQQVFNVGGRIAQQFPLLADFELIQANVSDLVGQVAVEPQARQRLFLFVENLREQQAAFEYVDLLVQRRIALGQAVQLLLGLQVLLGDFVEAVGAFEQVVRELQVGRAFGGQKAAAAGLLRFDGLLGDRFLGQRQTLLVDQGLQFLDFLIQAVGSLRQQVMLAVAEVLQLGIAGQFLAPQRDQGVQRRQLGIELVALLGAQGLAGVLAVLEGIVDLLDARLTAGYLRLGALGAGLGSDDQAVGIAQGFLQVALLGGALSEHLLQLLDRFFGEALRHRHHGAGLEAGQFALVLDRLLGGRTQRLLEIGQLLLVITLVVELVERALQDGLQSLLIGFRQFAVGNLVQARLHSFAGGRFGRLCRL
ncbi:hypothetical protein D9M71_252700 [compost metagenome]